MGRSGSVSVSHAAAIADSAEDDLCGEGRDAGTARGVCEAHRERAPGKGDRTADGRKVDGESDGKGGGRRRR